MSDLEIFYNRRKYGSSRKPSNYSQLYAKNQMNLLNIKSFDSNMKRSMSLCSIRTYMRSANELNDNGNIVSGNQQNESVVAHIERNALHSDIRRNSFSSRNGTRNFVINPLFDENGTDC